MPPKTDNLAQLAVKLDNLGVTTTENQSRTAGEATHKYSYYDKQSGSYGRVITKETMSSGDYTNRGKVGYKDEYKSSSTVRVGNDRGYTEYSNQEKVTRVDYGGGNTKNYGGNKLCGDNAGGAGADGDSNDGNDYSSDVNDAVIHSGGAGADGDFDDGNGYFSDVNDAVIHGGGAAAFDHGDSLHADFDAFDPNDFHDDGDASYDDFYYDGGDYDDYYYSDYD